MKYLTILSLFLIGCGNAEMKYELDECTKAWNEIQPKLIKLKVGVSTRTDIINALGPSTDLKYPIGNCKPLRFTVNLNDILQNVEFKD
jgi:hypothetical protein